MKKIISSKRWLIAYLTVLIAYICIGVSAIAVMVASFLKDDRELFVGSCSVAIMMLLSVVLLLFVNRRVCWVWVEKRVLKRKWLFMAKTESILFEWVDRVDILPDNRTFISFKRPDRRRHSGESMTLPYDASFMTAVRSFWSGTIYSHEPCDACKKMKLVGEFHDPEAYLARLAYLKELSERGNYKLIPCEHPIDAVQDQNGYWVDDFILHTLKCETCGALVSCCCDTYHGKGRLTVAPMPHVYDPNR